MKAYKELTELGQVRRIRPMALALLKRNRRKFDRVQLIHHGENTTFRAKGKQDYLCRIHRPGYQTLESIRSEMVLISHFQEAGLNVPRPVFLKGEAVQTLPAPNMDPRYGVLFEWLDGRFQKDLTATSGYRVGEFMARLHRSAETFKAPKGFYRPRLDEDGLLSTMGAKLTALDASDRRLFERVRDRFFDVAKELGHGKAQFGIIHCDLHLGNRLFKNGEVVAIDFDDAGWSWFMFDIAVCVSYHKQQPNFEEVWEAFLEGYRTVRPLSNAEVATFDTFVAVRQMQIALWILGRTDHPTFVARVPAAMQRTRDRLNAFLSVAS